MDRTTFLEWIEKNKLRPIQVSAATGLSPTTIQRFMDGGNVNWSTTIALERFMTEFEREKSLKKTAG